MQMISNIIASKPKLSQALDNLEESKQQMLKEQQIRAKSSINIGGRRRPVPNEVERFAYPTYFISEDYHIIDEKHDEFNQLKLEPNQVGHEEFLVSSRAKSR